MVPQSSRKLTSTALYKPSIGNQQNVAARGGTYISKLKLVAKFPPVLITPGKSGNRPLGGQYGTSAIIPFYRDLRWLLRPTARSHRSVDKNKEPYLKEVATGGERGLFAEPVVYFGVGNNTVLNGFGKGSGHYAPKKLIHRRYR